jgi:lysophospholipase L1-like esterase
MADVPVISNPLAGKKVSLIGDSITTWSTVRPDNTYSSRYPSGVIQRRDQTWWDQMITNGGMTLLRNTAYNGSSCTGRDGSNGHNTASTTDAYAACSNKRINDLSDGTSNPDIVICFIGINDFGSDKNTPTGNYIGLDVVPSDSATGMATFSEGYALMLKKIATQYPEARIYCCTLPSVGHGSVSDMYTTRWFGGSFPVYNTTTHAYLADYNNTIRTLAHNMGAGIIEFAECINWFNSATLLEDGLHPNIAGMKLLGDKALAKLQSDFAVVAAQ